MELLSPAGNMEKLKMAVLYGADAVYFGGNIFGLRANAGNFSIEEMQKAMEYLHNAGKKGYLTLNAYIRDSELDKLKQYIKETSRLVDAYIISDPGVFALAAELAPEVERHISTQANITNSQAVNFWADKGASRVVVARELPKAELAALIKNSKIDIEAFVHGAICISYSGRCIISAYMTGRDANRGECTQPCRWNYQVKEVTRPKQDFDIEEDERGTYLYNAKDLCLLDRIGELHDMGVKSLKIEGRMKSAMYTAVVTGVYRKAIDRALKGDYAADNKWRELLDSVSNRHYTEGFYSFVPDKEAMNYESSAYIRNADFLGVIKNFSETDTKAKFSLECRAKLTIGERLEILTPELDSIIFTPQKIIFKGEPVDNTKPSLVFEIEGELKRQNSGKIADSSLLRRQINQ